MPINTLQCRAKGNPWEIAKGFDTSLPVSRFLSKEEVGDPHNVTLWCKVSYNISDSNNREYNVTLNKIQLLLKQMATGLSLIFFYFVSSISLCFTRQICLFYPWK